MNGLIELGRLSGFLQSSSLSNIYMRFMTLAAKSLKSQAQVL